MDTGKEKRDPAKERKPEAMPSGDDAGSNAVEHEPDPQAEPIPDSHRKYVPPSPFTTGNT